MTEWVFAHAWLWEPAMIVCVVALIVTCIVMAVMGWRDRPSRLQRLHNQGDPTGEVQRVADQIIQEMKDEGTWT